MPGQVNNKVLYEIEQGRDAAFRALPDWLQKKIEMCEEWTHPVAASAAPEPEPAGESDDVPF